MLTDILKFYLHKQTNKHKHTHHTQNKFTSTNNNPAFGVKRSLIHTYNTPTPSTVTMYDKNGD